MELDTTVITVLVLMVKQIRKKYSKSFSLLELIIVISIVLLFSGLLLAQYGNFIEQSRLKTEANKLREVLELAKKKTTAREIVGTCITGFNGYKVDVQPSGYTLLSCCGGICDNSTIIQSFNLSSLINTISITTGSITIQFVPTPAKTLLTSDTTIRLQNTSIPTVNKCIDVTITKIGIIGVSDTFNSC